MVFSPSLYVEVIITLSNDGSSIIIGFTSFSLVYLLGIRYLLPLLEGFSGSIEAYFVDLLRLIYILLV